MSRVLITGATGFLGGAIVQRLRRDGADVLANGRNIKKLAALQLPDHSQVPLDLSTVNVDESLQHLRGVKTIVHCAAFSSPWGSAAAHEAANVRATENLIALSRALEVEHFIHVSTPAVYFRFRDQFGISEDMVLPRPVNEYARTKVIAETRVRMSGLPYTIVRPRGLYGEGDTALLPRLLRAANSGPLPRFRGGRAATDITYIDDAVDAIGRIIERREQATGQVFNISGGQALRIEHIVERAAAASGVTVRWRNLPVGPALAAVRLGEALARMHPARPEPKITAYGLGIFAYSQTLDLSKAHERLDWQPRVSLDEGLERTFRA